MSEITLTMEEEPTPEDVQTLHTILREYNAQFRPGRWKPLTLFLRDAAGRVVGGLRAETGWGVLFVETLVIAPRLRGQDYGTQLMQQAEAEALARGCRHAFLDTFSFQARPFYEKRGYTVFGEMDGYDGDERRYFMRKTLTPPDGENDLTQRRGDTEREETENSRKDAKTQREAQSRREDSSFSLYPSSLPDGASS